ncbi:uncharacterized protein [Primulina huaijiensis]|uniref:uncharacterized protein isoform X2 n=1 Tax=Primulina huaijiensis TaxID=1492673 RepID=UPI003CC75B9A
MHCAILEDGSPLDSISHFFLLEVVLPYPFLVKIENLFWWFSPRTQIQGSDSEGAPHLRNNRGHIWSGRCCGACSLKRGLLCCSCFIFQVLSDIRSQNNDACLKAFQLDLSSLKSIIKFKSSIHHWLIDSNIHPSIQLLINNAGILATSCRITSEGYDQMMAINYIGAFCLTKVLLPLLENSPVPSRVVNVSSFTHWNVWDMPADRETVSGTCFLKSRCYPYAQIYEFSKLCLLLFTYELHRQAGRAEKSHHLSVVAVDPGAVKTNIMREIPSCISQMAYIVLNILGLLHSSETGVRAIVDGALAPPEISGVYFFGGSGCCLKSSALSHNVKLAEDLWVTSCDLFQELQLAS